VTAGNFQRARTAQQRDQRRRDVLDAARDMLGQMPLADISLRELSKRIGLAKSNVIRYFPSREAVFLAVLAEDWDGWLDLLQSRLDPAENRLDPAENRLDPAENSLDPAENRLDPAENSLDLLESRLPDGSPAGSDPAGSDLAGSDLAGQWSGRRAVHQQLAAVVAQTLSECPRLCELIAAAQTILEHNIPVATAREFKLAAQARTRRLAAIVQSVIPALPGDRAFEFAGVTWALIAGAWPMANPSPSVARALADPELADFCIEFGPALTSVLAIVLDGMAAGQFTGSPGRPERQEPDP
jgi:AcrR family transcriptional regulator